MTKEEVRALAKECELPNGERPDSQGLCFLGKVKFDDFIGSYLGTKEGDVRDAKSGDIIGRHNGLWFHTVGQRRGVGQVIDPKKGNLGPWFVVEKRNEENVLVLSNEYNTKEFEERRKKVAVQDIAWIDGEGDSRKERGGRYTMKCRHGPDLVQGELILESSESGVVVLDEKDGGLAPGQFIVFYDEEGYCLGSAVIGEAMVAKAQTN